MRVSNDACRPSVVLVSVAAITLVRQSNTHERKAAPYSGLFPPRRAAVLATWPANDRVPDPSQKIIANTRNQSLKQRQKAESERYSEERQLAALAEVSSSKTEQTMTFGAEAKTEISPLEM